MIEQSSFEMNGTQNIYPTQKEPADIYENIPCRLSIKNISAANQLEPFQI